MIDLKYMSLDELAGLSQKVAAELSQRNVMKSIEELDKSEEEFRSSPEVQAIKERLISLQAEFERLPQEFDIGKTIEFKMRVDNVNYYDVAEMLDNSCEDILGLSLECTNLQDLPDDLACSVERTAEDFSDECLSADTYLDDVQCYQWKDFIKKVKKLEEDSAFVYEFGLTPGELLD